MPQVIKLVTQQEGDSYDIQGFQSGFETKKKTGSKKFEKSVDSDKIAR
jgi:hypothetical protein